jgi:flagellar hook-associated protein 2
MSTSPVAAQAAAANQQAAQAIQQAAQSLISASTGTPLDVTSLVTTLVNAKIAGPHTAISTQIASDRAEIGGLGLLSSSMLGLQTALAPFLNGSALASFSATLSGDGITAKAGKGASAATYQIDTKQIAEAQTITSGSFSKSDANALGSGTLNISLGSGAGSKSFQVDVDPSNDSLQDVVNAINSAPGNPGIRATIIGGANGPALSLQSTSTGAANTISIGVTGAASDSALAKLAVTSSTATDPNAPDGSSAISSNDDFWTQSQAAQDAQLTVNNVLVTDSTNTISDAIPGVTLTLTDKGVGAQTLTVAPDDGTVETDLSAFVTAYNAVIDQLNSLAAPGTANVPGSGGQLLGDEMINQVGASLGSIVGGLVSNGGLQGTLASLGITFQKDTGGEPFAELQIDADSNNPTLDDAVTSNPALIGALFNDTNGIAQQLDSVLTAYTSVQGILASRTNDLTTDIASLAKQQTDLDDFAAQLTTQFNDQFTALNTIMAQAQSNASFLTALFGGANSSGALANNSK